MEKFACPSFYGRQADYQKNRNDDCVSQRTSNITTQAKQITFDDQRIMGDCKYSRKINQLVKTFPILAKFFFTKLNDVAANADIIKNVPRAAHKYGCSVKEMNRSDQVNP
jgi:hypothetical protein